MVATFLLFQKANESFQLRDSISINVGALVTRKRVTLHLCVMVIPTEEQQISLSGTWVDFFSSFLVFLQCHAAEFVRRDLLEVTLQTDSHLKKTSPTTTTPLLARTPDQPTGPFRSTSSPSSYSLSLRPTRCHGNRWPWRKSTSGTR